MSSYDGKQNEKKLITLLTRDGIPFQIHLGKPFEPFANGNENENEKKN
jgi:hypothetical protein